MMSLLLGLVLMFLTFAFGRIMAAGTPNGWEAPPGMFTLFIAMVLLVFTFAVSTGGVTVIQTMVH
jgi:hypothetical protein